MFLQQKIREINERFRALEKTSHVAVWGAEYIHASYLRKQNYCYIL